MAEFATIVDDGNRAGAFILGEAEFQRSRDNIILEGGQGYVKAGTVLGQRKIGTGLGGSSAAKSGGNTGNGTFVLDATTPVKAGAKLGVYTLRATAAVANGGTFVLKDPDGVALGSFTITAGPGGTVTVDSDIKGVITDGSTDFIVGDGFDITVTPAKVAAKSGGNTGNGTFVIDATTPVRTGAKSGIYTLRIITAVANGGVARLEDPDGDVLGDFTIPPGAGNSITIDDEIKGVLTDGTTDFIVGDGFDVTVAGGSKKWVVATATGVTGAERGAALNVYPADTTTGDKKVSAIVRQASVNGKVIVYGSTVTTDAQKDAQNAFLAAAGIIVRSTGWDQH